jgi:hypothetical protein
MPVPTSQQPATEDGCRERALSNKDNQHAILAWTIYLLKSQRELSDGDVVMLQQTTKTRVLHESTLSSDCAFLVSPFTKGTKKQQNRRTVSTMANVGHFAPGTSFQDL